MHKNIVDRISRTLMVKKQCLKITAGIEIPLISLTFSKLMMDMKNRDRVLDIFSVKFIISHDGSKLYVISSSIKEDADGIKRVYKDFGKDCVNDNLDGIQKFIQDTIDYILHALKQGFVSFINNYKEDLNTHYRKFIDNFNDYFKYEVTYINNPYKLPETFEITKCTDDYLINNRCRELDTEYWNTHKNTHFIGIIDEHYTDEDLSSDSTDITRLVKRMLTKIDALNDIKIRISFAFNTPADIPMCNYIDISPFIIGGLKYMIVYACSETNDSKHVIFEPEVIYNQLSDNLGQLSDESATEFCTHLFNDIDDIYQRSKLSSSSKISFNLEYLIIDNYSKLNDIDDDNIEDHSNDNDDEEYEEV